MMNFCLADIAILATIDVAGAAYLWWLIDKQIAGDHAATSRAGARANTRE